MNTEFFSFPLNLAISLLYLAVLLYVYREHRECRFVRWMLSPYATISALVLFAFACLVVGFSSDRGLTGSLWFIAVLLFFMTVLLMVTFRGIKRDGKLRWAFLLNHAGLLIALGSAFWGAPDSVEYVMQLYRGKAENVAYRTDGSSSVLGYGLTLEDFAVEYFENGVPSVFEARIEVDNKNVNKNNKNVELKVNHPFNLSFSDALYLSGYDSRSGAESEYVVVRIVHEPWRYWALAGIILMICGAFVLFVRGPRKGKYDKI